MLVPFAGEKGAGDMQCAYHFRDVASMSSLVAEESLSCYLPEPVSRAAICCRLAPARL